MAKGRKPDINKAAPGQMAAVFDFPIDGKPDAWHHAQAEGLCPEGLNSGEAKIWNRIAPELSKLGRLKPLYVDVIAQYCVVSLRLADARKTLDEKDWIYITEGRHGTQIKSRPEVAQLNDDWRKWRSLVGELGLSPAAARGLSQGQGDLFDDFDNF